MLSCPVPVEAGTPTVLRLVWWCWPFLSFWWRARIGLGGSKLDFGLFLVLPAFEAGVKQLLIASASMQPTFLSVCQQLIDVSHGPCMCSLGSPPTLSMQPKFRIPPKLVFAQLRPLPMFGA